MKKYTKKIMFCLCTAVVFGMVACGSTQKKSEVAKGTPMYSNMASDGSAEEVKTLLSTQLDKDSVNDYFKQVTEYNEIVGASGLQGEFTKFDTPEYDVEKISTLWAEKKGDFVGTNCRINSFILLKNNIEIPNLKSDSELLFLDNDSIDK